MRDGDGTSQIRDVALHKTRLLGGNVAPLLGDWLHHLPGISFRLLTHFFRYVDTLLYWSQLGHKLGDVRT